MAFDYPVNLDLTGRRCVVVGGGPLGTERATGLVASAADVVVVARTPSDELRALADAGAIDLRERRAELDDLAGAFLAIHTREDGTPDEIAGEVSWLWAHAAEHGVLFAALDDVPHCMFGAASIVRRGDLRITVSTAGKAPALSKRLRRALEEEYDEAYGDLVAALETARAEALPRDIPFAEWAARWEAALEDLEGLVALVRAGDTDEVVRRVLAVVRPAP
ncbi:MAG: siroheme synthase [Actinobacteria bacterium]|nr:siroheme synthase [Actinomycetota bacterium]